MANPTPNFPGALHSSVDVSVFSSSGLGATSPAHTSLEGKQEEEILATQRKLGAGSAIPAVGKFLVGVGTGSSTWTTANTLPINGSGIAFTQSGTSTIIAFLDNNGNMYISGNYLKL